MYFFVTLFCLVLVGKQIKQSQKLKPDTKLSFFKDFKEGFRSLSKNRGVIILMLLATVITFYLGIIETMIKPMLLEITDSKTVGTITSISATGMLLTSLIFGVKAIKNYKL